MHPCPPFIPTLAGVPQGSILAPILCSTYTADILLHSSTTFADDTYILSPHPDPVQAFLHLQESWFPKWRTKINAQKSTHITFTLKSGECHPVFLNDISTQYIHITIYIYDTIHWSSFLYFWRCTSSAKYIESFYIQILSEFVETPSDTLLRYAIIRSYMKPPSLF
jgi:hypothetical protein